MPAAMPFLPRKLSQAGCSSGQIVHTGRNKVHTPAPTNSPYRCRTSAVGGALPVIWSSADRLVANPQ